MYYALKIILSAGLIMAISEIAKRSSYWGGIMASLPLISIIAFIFLYEETKDIKAISSLSTDIFWLVIPSLALFVMLPLLLKKGVNFYASLGLSCLVTIVCYYLMTLVLKKFGVL